MVVVGVLARTTDAMDGGILDVVITPIQI